MASFEKHLKKFARTAVEMRDNIKSVIDREETEMRLLEQEKANIANEGTELIKEFRSEENAKNIARSSEVHNVTTAPVVNREIQLIDKTEKGLKRMHTLNSELLRLIGEQEYYLKNAHELSRKLAEQFEIVRYYYRSISDINSMRAIYSSLEAIRAITQQKIGVIGTIEERRKRKEDINQEIEKIRNEKEEDDKKVIGLTKYVRKLDKKDKELAGEMERLAA